MKVYVLFSGDDIVPEAIGVYTTFELAKKHMLGVDDFVVKTVMNANADHDLGWPERKERKQ